MGEPREYGPKGGTVLFLDLLATFSPNLSEIDQNRVPSLAQGWYNLTKSLSYEIGEKHDFVNLNTVPSDRPGTGSAAVWQNPPPTPPALRRSPGP